MNRSCFWSLKALHTEDLARISFTWEELTGKELKKKVNEKSHYPNVFTDNPVPVLRTADCGSWTSALWRSEPWWLTGFLMSPGRCLQVTSEDMEPAPLSVPDKVMKMQLYVDLKGHYTIYRIQIHLYWVHTWATSSVCSFWNILLRASQANPAMSARAFIPDMSGPMVSRAAMERTHSYTQQTRECYGHDSRKEEYKSCHPHIAERKWCSGS